MLLTSQVIMFSITFANGCMMEIEWSSFIVIDIRLSLLLLLLLLFEWDREREQVGGGGGKDTERKKSAATVGLMGGWLVK
jgi:hypothetical protein